MSEPMEQICVGHDGDVSFISIECDSETSTFWGRVLPLVRGRHLVLDLALWRGDTSFLVQELLLLASMVQRRETRLWLARVPLAVTRRLGTQKRKISGASFLSVEAPYYCTVCATDRVATLDITPELMRRSRNPEESLQPQICSQCFTAMQFNESPEAFLGFMDHFAAPVGPGGLRKSAEQARRSAQEVVIPTAAHKPLLPGSPETANTDLSPIHETASPFLVLETLISLSLVLCDLLLLWTLF